MIISTTPTLDGYKITDYCGVVFGECIGGTNFVKDIIATFTDVLGQRNTGYEESLMNARNVAIDEMMESAEAIGADAIVGLKIDYESIETMLVVAASGTAVNIKERISI